MQKEVFNDAPPSSPIDGMRLKLERKIDLQRPCCSNTAMVHAGKGLHAAELRCAKCGSHRGCLPREAVNWLQVMIANFPEAKNDTHVFRDSKPNSHLTAREEIGIRQRETRIENGSRKSSANGR
jgi:hypothetical protein